MHLFFVWFAKSLHNSIGNVMVAFVRKSGKYEILGAELTKIGVQIDETAFRSKLDEIREEFQ